MLLEASTASRPRLRVDNLWSKLRDNLCFKEQQVSSLPSATCSVGTI